MRFVLSAVPVLAAALWILPATAAGPPPGDLGKLSYAIEWRLIHAGDAVLEAHDSEARLKLDSAGLVSALFTIDDTYTVRYEQSFCATGSVLDAKQGKRHRQTTVTYDRNQNRAAWVERDLLKNEVLRTAQVEIPHCVHDVLAGFWRSAVRRSSPGNRRWFP